MAENTTTLIKFLGEEGTQAFVENVKDLLSNKANTSHTHTAEDIGADERGSAVNALSLANQYTNEQLSTIVTGDIIVKESEHSSTADSATNADSAINAENAIKAIQDGNGNVIIDTYETKTDASAKLTEAKTYADTVASNVKSDLLNGAGTAYDTLKELGDLIDDNTDAIDALELVASGKADKTHSHAISEITNLQTQLDNKQAKITGAATSVLYTNLTSGKVLCSSSNGKVVASSIDSATLNSVDFNHFLGTTSKVQTQLDNKADATHSHEIADVTGLQTALDGKASASHGTHVSFDATNKPKMDGTAAFGTSSKVARADHVHPTDTSRASQADLDALETVVAGKAASSHSHSTATTSAAGFMSTDMVTKLNGIAAGANKTTVDSSLSTTSTNPVQNKVVNSAITANTNSISTHTNQISALQTAVNDIQEITSEEVQGWFA